MLPPTGDHAIQDLVDFYHRWPELREEAVSVAETCKLEGGQREILGWMIKVIDRVGPADLAKENRDVE
ncbi:hypothetical protein [Litorivita sp. NS0012-18]|uniref:hypothetical protein n=1 Tax=Litorivita sp. NS0012-18 TaxID=3127655 RepID=UPI00310787C4